MNAMRWVLLPGLDGTGQLFEGFLQHVRGEWVTVVTYPGNAAWCVDDYVAHADAIIPRDAPCILIAESFSGPIALRLLQRNAEVRGVVLVASFVTCPHPVLRALPLRLVTLLHAAMRSDVLLRAFCLGWDAPDEWVASLRRAIQALPTDVLCARLRLLRNLDESASLASVRVPILLLDAARDRLVWARARASSDTPHALREVVDGPHFLLQRCPRECWRAIAVWQRSCAESA